MTCAHTSWSTGSTAHDPRAGTRRRWALFLTFENEVLVNRAVADFLARANASVEALSEKLRGLKARQLELTDAIEDQQVSGPSPAKHRGHQGHHSRASRQGPTPSAKRCCRTWWAEVRVHSRKAVVPVFRPPPPHRPQEETAVRKCSDWLAQAHAMYPAAEIRAISTPRRRSSQSVGAIAGRESRLECRDRLAV